MYQARSVPYYVPYPVPLYIMKVPCVSFPALAMWCNSQDDPDKYAHVDVPEECLGCRNEPKVGRRPEISVTEGCPSHDAEV